MTGDGLGHGFMDEIGEEFTLRTGCHLDYKNCHFFINVFNKEKKVKTYAKLFESKLM